MSKRVFLGVGVLLLIVAGLILYCVHGPAAGARSSADAAGPRAGGDPLAAYRGKTLLLVLGMPGCPGTERITSGFAEYAVDKPAQVELLRVDVPPPGGTLDETGSWPAPFPRLVDRDRTIATQLDFFFYPTFYAIDRDGTVRFAGPFDLAQAKAMAAALVAEPPGAPKRMFSPPMPAIGALPGAFTGTTLGGENVALSDLLGPRATLLFFGATTCPFSKQATLTLPRLAAAFAAKGAAIAIIDQGEQTEDIRAFYAGQQVPVIVDADNRISLGAFGVWAVPYFFVLDAQGKVVDRQPYTEAAGTTALAGALGLTTGVTLPQAGAG